MTITTIPELCEGCGSPGPTGECAPDCDWGVCPGCGYEGSADFHVVADLTSVGFAGGRIEHVEFACGHVEHDETADVMAAR